MLYASTHFGTWPFCGLQNGVMVSVLLYAVAAPDLFFCPLSRFAQLLQRCLVVAGFCLRRRFPTAKARHANREKIHPQRPKTVVTSYRLLRGRRTRWMHENVNKGPSNDTGSGRDLDNSTKDTENSRHEKVHDGFRARQIQSLRSERAPIVKQLVLSRLYQFYGSL